MKLPKDLIGHIRMIHPNDYGLMSELVMPTKTLFDTIRDKVPLEDMGRLAAAADAGGHAHIQADGTVRFLPDELVETNDDAAERSVPRARLAA